MAAGVLLVSITEARCQLLLSVIDSMTLTCMVTRPALSSFIGKAQHVLMALVDRLLNPVLGPLRALEAHLFGVGPNSTGRLGKNQLLCLRIIRKLLVSGEKREHQIFPKKSLPDYVVFSDSGWSTHCPSGPLPWKAQFGFISAFIIRRETNDWTVMTRKVRARNIKFKSDQPNNFLEAAVTVPPHFPIVRNFLVSISVPLCFSPAPTAPSVSTP
jgi:uncharacterized protein YggT (Ycf19 family)